MSNLVHLLSKLTLLTAGHTESVKILFKSALVITSYVLILRMLILPSFPPVTTYLSLTSTASIDFGCEGSPVKCIAYFVFSNRVPPYAK